MTSRPRAIIHLDMDAFYASVEVLDNPALSGKPVIVGGDERRGVVAAASYEARKFGVHSAQPIARAKRLCPHGVFLPVRMARYKEVSERVFGIFRRFTPLVEQLSIDEVFLDVTGSVRLHGPPDTIARKIREAVRKETGLSVSAGVAAVKFVAKIASDLRKPDGLTIVPAGAEKEFLAPLAVGKLWGVGEVTAAALAGMGVRTVGDLAGVPAETLKSRFGAHGSHLHLLSNGIDDRPVETEEEAKSIGHEDTYPEDILDREVLKRELLSLAERVAARLRRHGVRGRTVTLKVKYHDFRQVTRAATLPGATDDGGVIYRTATGLLGKTDAGKMPVRLLGISVARLEGEGEGGERKDPEQLSLFPPGGAMGMKGPAVAAGADTGPAPAASVPAEKKAKLNRAVDAIREKFGKKGIRPATLLGEE